MVTSKKLEIIYHNGQPDGIRSIRRHLSTMTTYVIPRPLLAEAKKITGINRPGIYYLINENDENKIAQIYIGQTRNGVVRLDDHNRSKDFWNKAIMFLADSKTFSLDMISGLEEYAIMKAHESNRYKVENSVKPKYEIDEYDLPSIEEMYEEIQFIMATQGYKMDNAKMSMNEADIFQTSRKGIPPIPRKRPPILTPTPPRPRWPEGASSPIARGSPSKTRRKTIGKSPCPRSRSIFCH